MIFSNTVRATFLCKIILRENIALSLSFLKIYSRAIAASLFLYHHFLRIAYITKSDFQRKSLDFFQEQLSCPAYLFFALRSLSWP